MAKGSPSGHPNFTIEVGRIMKSALNMYLNATISEDAITDVQRCITDLIAIISSEAVHKVELVKHKERAMEATLAKFNIIIVDEKIYRYYRSFGICFGHSWLGC
nr:hypothetical protein Iba_chr02dCG12780 [Ipomoea batatas]